MHPGQYNQVGAKNPDVFDSTVSDLSMHADILDYMNIDKSGYTMRSRWRFIR
jgi:UV DNA damage repair endonuclease